MAHVSWVFRNESQQTQAVIDKVSETPWPRSQHNKMMDGKPCARAFDLFEIDQRGRAVWDPSFFRAIWKFVEAKGFPVKWGGAWKSIGDANHFELHKTVEPLAEN